MKVFVLVKFEINNLDELKSWRREVGIVKCINYEWYFLCCDVEFKFVVRIVYVYFGNRYYVENVL